jgi:hypothetical protein
MPQSRAKVRRQGMAKLRSIMRYRYVPLPWDSYWYDGNWTSPYFYVGDRKVRFPSIDRKRNLAILSTEERRQFFIENYPEVIAIMIGVGFGSTIIELPGWRSIRYRVRDVRSKDRRKIADWLGKLANDPQSGKGERAMLRWYRRCIRNGSREVDWYVDNGWIITLPIWAEVPPTVYPFVHTYELHP